MKFSQLFGGRKPIEWFRPLSFFLAICILTTGCDKAGVQGTSSFSSFQGLDSITVLSPTAVRLQWNLDGDFSSYRVYQNSSTSPLKTETFSQTIVSSLLPGTQYTFLVNGVSSDGSESISGATRAATTFSRFQGLKAGGVTVRSSTQIALTWDQNSASATYEIFVKPEGGEYVTDTPSESVTGTNQIVVSSLNPGQQYCFYVVAKYLDGTSEPSSSSSAMEAGDHCQRLTSDLPDLPAVSIQSVVPTDLAWFISAGGNPAYTIDVYELDTDIRVASRTGPGTFRAFRSTGPGKKNYYSLVTSGSQVARVPVEITTGVNPTGVQFRNLKDRTPLFPEIQSGGRGQQNLGENLVTGDFNCDGLPDVAASIHNATPMITSSFNSQIGGVHIYYTYDPPVTVDGDGNIIDLDPALKVDVAPTSAATFPNPQLIFYPPNGDSNRIGKSLATGNANGDCAYRNPDGTVQRGNCSDLFNSVPSSDTHLVYQCDDLVIGTDYGLAGGRFYTIYGTDQAGLIPGSGGSSYGLDEATCDPLTGSCRAVAMSAPTTYAGTSFGGALAFGDFNNDGYDDVAVAANLSSTGINDILIFRGSALGLQPYGFARNHVSISSASLSVGTHLHSTLISNTDDFGVSLAAVPNSRRCLNGGGRFYRSPIQPQIRKGYDETKCDDLVIGAPMRGSGRGSILSCRATSLDDASLTDKQRILGWTCLEHYPNVTNGIVVKGYGQSLLGVENQNGYPLKNIFNTSQPEIAGALFVGAPESTVLGQSGAGAVFGYYVTPQSTTSITGIAGIAGVLNNNLAIPQTHDVGAINDVPCDRWNANKSFGDIMFCEHQALTMAPAEGNARFGFSLGSVPTRIRSSEVFMPYLAVGAKDRDVYSRDGTRILTDAGTIYLYRPDLSTFGFEGASPISAPKYRDGDDFFGSPTCVSDCTWYSGGVSPFGPSIVYPFDLNSGSGLGRTPAVGVLINDDSDVDLLVSAGSYNQPNPGNGGLFGFYSSTGFSPSLNTPNMTVNYSTSKEGRYEFEQAKVIGDLNNDGFDDVVTHVNSNGTWKMIVFYGSASGLIQTPAPSPIPRGLDPVEVSSDADLNMGSDFYPAGDVNGDGFADIITFGNKGAYLFYGGSSGLVVSTEPSVAPVGKNPLLFGVSKSDSIPKIVLSAGAVSSASLPWDAGFEEGFSNGVVHGDFNKDGYSDLAIRMPASVLKPANDAQGEAIEVNFAPGSVGRVVIVYGSNIGPLTNRQTGVIYLEDALGEIADVLVLDPCRPGSSCKVQMLAPPTVAGTQGHYASSTVVLRGRGKGLSSPTQLDVYDNLLVSNPTHSVQMGQVYFYEGSAQGLKPTLRQTLVPRDIAGPSDDRQYFGVSMIELGDVNGDQYTDVAISAPQFNSNYLGSTTKPQVYVFFGGAIEGKNAFYGAGTLASTNYWAAPAIVDNSEHGDIANPRPQVLFPSNLVTTSTAEVFGRYLAPLGDFNSDTYADFVAVSPNGDQGSTGSLSDTGYALLYFGGPKGIRVGNGALASTNPRCYGGADPVCEAWQIFLPNMQNLELMMIGPNSTGDINGDGMKDLVIGTVGREHPSNDAFATGAIYVLY